MPLAPKTQLGRYEIRSLLGAGAAVAFGIRSYWHADSTEVAVESIAVVPFVNQNKDPGADWISDGLTESIINNLTQLPNLKVIARSSVFRYKGRADDPLSIGKELGVRAVLIGRLMKRFDEAIAEIKRALELDPMSVIMNRIYADILMDMRRYDEAMQQYRKTLELDPNFPTTLYFLGRAYEAKGMYDQAVAHYDMAGQRSSLPVEILADAKQVYAKLGWKAYLEKSLEQILAQPSNRRFPPFVVASYYARLGRKDEAFAWLQRGYEERDFRMRHVGVSFEFDSLRPDPRFADFLRRLELPL